MPLNSKKEENMHNTIIVVITDRDIAERFLANINGDKTVAVRKVNQNLYSTAANTNTIRENAVRLLKQGKDPQDVAKELGVSVHKIRAYKAHITMGTY